MFIACAQGRDIYREQAAEGIFGPGQWRRWAEIDKNQRQVMGKVPTLAMLYRISPQGLKEYAWKYYEIDWTIRQATAVWSAFHRLWPEFQRWHSLEEAKLRNRGWARSPVGRLRRLPGALSGQHDDIRAGINAPIQSCASDITQEAGILCDADIQAHPELDLKLVGDIHDALLVQAPESRALQAARWLESRMRQAPAVLRQLGLLVPPGLIKVEVTIGAWGEGKVPEEWARSRLDTQLLRV
jgi:DNA polymerase I-like protein with 3'-5' exonuclease and polymerase domains